MFAFLFVEEMDPFYQIIGSYPTAIYTVLLAVSIFYWLVVVLGFFSIDMLDVEVPEPQSEIADMNVMAGVLFKFGLNGVPLTIVVTLISMIGWLICFYGVALFTNKIEISILNLVAETLLLLLSLFISAMITAQIIRPLRKFFLNEQKNTVESILGKSLVVRSSRVDANFGEAGYEDGGAGLILKVRSLDGHTHKKGDVVVPIEYVSEKNIYRVISDSEFLGKNTN